MGARTTNYGRVVSSEAGMTLLELIIVCAILMILASAAMPVARYTVKRQKEAALRQDLREMRDAIDRYKDAADKNRIRVEVGTEGYPPDLDTLVMGVSLSAAPSGTTGVLGTNGTVAGITPGSVGATGGAIGAIGAIISGQTGLTGGGPSGMPAFGSSQTSASNAGTPATQLVRFLRRIPTDPMTGKAEWGMRSVSDDPDAQSWSGKDVFDVYSLSTGMAMDGTNYKDW